MLFLLFFLFVIPNGIPFSVVAGARHNTTLKQQNSHFFTIGGENSDGIEIKNGTQNRYLISVPQGGLWNQMMAIGHAMAMCNLTNRDLLIAGFKPAFDEPTRVNASRVIDIFDLAERVGPLMGLKTHPSKIWDLDLGKFKEWTWEMNLTTISPNICFVDAAYEHNGSYVLMQIQRSFSQCQFVSIGNSILRYPLPVENGFYLQQMLGAFKFSRAIELKVNHLKQNHFRKLSNCLTLHYRLEDDMVEYISTREFLSKNGEVMSNTSIVANLMISAYLVTINRALIATKAQCIYICTGLSMQQIKETINVFKANISTPISFYFKLHSLSSKRELMAIEDFMVATSISIGFVGTKFSSFSAALASRMDLNNAFFIEDYFSENGIQIDGSKGRK